MPDDRPLLLDLYCCAGGASVGYSRAGFDVIGSDLSPQKNYPFPFRRDNAIRVLERLLAGEALAFGNRVVSLERIAAIHTSPPCQRYTAGNRAGGGEKWPDLVRPTRLLLMQTGKPWVIENVAGAPLIGPVLLCGRQFGLTAVDDDGTVLQLDRHRLFETSFPLLVQPHAPHDRRVQVAGAYGGARRDKHEARHERHGGYVPSFAVQQRLLGVDWTTERELQESIPPVYAEYIGASLIPFV